MASVGDVLTALEKFELDLLEKQWAEDIWSSEFTSCPDDLPDEFSEKFSPLSYCDIVQVIEQADNVINTWLNDCNDAASIDSESTNSSMVGPSWTQLQEFDCKTLLALLYYYISKGHVNNQDVVTVHTCLKATNFYFTLLMIPGSSVYKVFHLTLFEKCLETFSLHKYLEIATRTKVKKVKQSSNNDHDHDSDDEYLDMDETMSLSQQQNVVKQMNFLLTTFQDLVKKFSFKKYPEALNMSLNILAELSRIERTCTLQEFSTNNNNSSFAPLSRNAYLTMKTFCSDTHGRVSEIIRLVLYYIMPNLTSIGGPAIPEMAKWNNKELTNIRNIAVSFVTDNIITMGEDAHLGLKILLQQICFNMIDRADYRTKATEMVLQIMSKLPMNLYYTIITWIFRLAMMEGAHHRVIGLELLSKLIYLKPGTNEMTKLNETQNTHSDSQFGISQSIQNPSDTTQNRTDTLGNRTDTLQTTEVTTNATNEKILSFVNQPINYVPLEYRRAMLSIIVDRIRDESATVRTRALSVLSDLIANKGSPTVLHLMQNIFVKPYLTMNSIANITNSKENEFLKWKTFVANLDKVRDIEINKTLIPGGRVIMAKVFEKCLDPRVNVRKAALQVVAKIFKFCPKWMTDENLELFGNHCRDPALSIRKEMVGSVMELMLFFPDHSPLLKLWVEEVVPQITDREIRVQGQVLQVLTEGIISRITTHERMRTAMDELPWKLLKRIAELKMRSFLVTACSLWSKSKDVNLHSYVKMIKTHVGTENDGPAWVLLSSISEYVDIEDPKFVMNYYLDVVSQGNCEPAIAYLVLVTLNNSWQRLKKDNQEMIQNVMYNNLKSYSVHPTLIGLTVDIATAITVTLAEEELAGKQEVAKWAMEIIQDCDSHLETCLKTGANFECQQCISTLGLLGCLAAICPDKIKHTTFLLLYNYLMNKRSEISQYDRKLRAITVIALAKMALRCDSFARSLVAGLAQLLQTSSDPVLLNNVIVAISDIGERYANLIEPLISSICVCLKSHHKSLREITLILLVELLQEDYLKARGALVYHLLTLVNDPDPRAVNIVKYYFTNCLLARHPYKMYQLLLPGLFHLNNYHSHPDYPRLEMTDAESKAFDLSGPDNQKQRMNVYQFMVSNVPDMVRMKCLHFICTVVLNGVADNIISISKRNGEQLLHDALLILLSKEIKIGYEDLVSDKNEDGEEENNLKEKQKEPIYKLGKQMFLAAQKKEIMETVIPICCKLKKKLAAEKKKLLFLFYKVVKELVKGYKDEINEIFKDDKQFGKEILYEIENMANAEEEEGSDDEAENAEKDKENENEAGVVEDAMGTHIAAVIEETRGRRRENSRRNEEMDAIEEMPEQSGEVQESEVPTPAVSTNEKDANAENENENGANAQMEIENGANTQKDKNKAVNALKEKAQKAKNVRPVTDDLDAIEAFDAEIHAPGRRRGNSNAEWRMSNASSVGSDDVPRQFDVRVQVERLDMESLNQSVNEEPEKSPQMRELRVSLEKLPDEVTVRPPLNRARRSRSAGELSVKSKEDNNVPTRKLSIQLERLSAECLMSLEKSTEKSLIEKSKEDLQKLKVSVEKLDIKRLKLSVSKKKHEDSEKVIAEGAEKIIMPPPHAPNAKKSKKVSTPKQKKSKTPVTPEIESRNLLTSTPMAIVGSDNFEVDISPVIDDE